MQQTFKTPHILVLDDEKEIADLVGGIFETEGMQVDVFYDPFTAMDAIRNTLNGFDLAIIDVMMPGMDGFEFCRNVRNESGIPIVFLTAKDEESDVVVGLTLGADDYVFKPFKPRELVARVKAHLRRAMAARHDDNLDAEESGSHNESSTNDNSVDSQEREILMSQGIEVDPRTHKATLYDIALSLTPKEFDLLAHLLKHKGEPVASKDLYEAVWKEEANASSSNTVMVHIRHLRCKLAEIDSSKDFIETAWGVGYRMAE